MTRRQLYLSDALQGIHYLLLLELQLLLVGHMLPLATSANAKHVAHRLHAHRRCFDETYNLPLGIRTARFQNLHVTDVTFSRKRHKEHFTNLITLLVSADASITAHTIKVRYTFALGSISFNLYARKNRQFLLFSFHYLIINVKNAQFCAILCANIWCNQLFVVSLQRIKIKAIILTE